MRKLLALFLLLVPIAKAKDLPDNPQPQERKFSRKVFLAGTTLLAASTTADAVSTRILLNNGGWENNSEYGLHPSVAKQAGINAAFFAAEVGIFTYTERNRRWYVRWGGRAYVGLVVANHFELAACNATIDTHAAHARNCHPILPF
jgi:hypothetical protein